MENLTNMERVDGYSKGELAQIVRRKNLTKVVNNKKIYKRNNFKNF